MPWGHSRSIAGLLVFRVRLSHTVAYPVHARRVCGEQRGGAGAGGAGPCCLCAHLVIIFPRAPQGTR